MANRSYLLNTDILTSDPQVLQVGLSRGSEYVEIAEAAYRIPLPWLCCFRNVPLYKVSVPMEAGFTDGQAEPFVIELPCVEVATAKRNLELSLSIFQEVAGDPGMGEDYWKLACDGLADLPLPYLTLNPIEVLFMGDPTEESVAFAACIRSPSPPISLMKRISGFKDGFSAFSAKDFYSLPLAELDHQARLSCSRSLDSGYLGRDHRYWHRSTPSPTPSTSDSMPESKVVAESFRLAPSAVDVPLKPDLMSNEPFDPSKQLYPLGYLLRLAAVLALVIGGGVCVIFYNQIVGGVMWICVPFFQRFSGLREMHKKHKAEMAAFLARSRELKP